jgi:AraC-like DNA-binding protein
MQAPLVRVSFDAARLLCDHPPKVRHANKTALFELAYPPGSEVHGTIEVARWRADIDDELKLPQHAESTVEPNFYNYPPSPAGTLAWHVNFADPNLFVAYGSGLFAQDEMQVAEHPLLGSVREALLAAELPALARDDDGGSPILVRGVERPIDVQTNPDPTAGRPFGLYGNRFAAASVDTVRRATRKIVPATISNIIAVAGPACGHGQYKPNQIEYILETAFTAFAAARHETLRALGPTTQITIHTGFWGCGAFGGNRRLMIALQSLAARAASIDRVAYHAGDAAGVLEVRHGLDVADMLAVKCGPESDLGALIDRCVQLGFEWGVSDGN